MQVDAVAHAGFHSVAKGVAQVQCGADVVGLPLICRYYFSLGIESWRWSVTLISIEHDI